MSTPRTPREGCAWTDERCDQLRKLETLLNTASLLNNSTNVLGNIQAVIDIANELRKWGKYDANTDSTSFINFVRQQVIEDRFPSKQKGGTQ